MRPRCGDPPYKVSTAVGKLDTDIIGIYMYGIYRIVYDLGCPRPWLLEYRVLQVFRVQRGDFGI